MVIVSLPDPEGLREALAKAASAGLLVTSFNSGRGIFTEASSVRHVSVDEFAGGQEAGRLLNRQGLNGVVLYLIHEPVNIGVVERCDGLEDAYEGTVQQFSVANSGTADLAATETAIAGRLRDADRPEAGILSLNAIVSLEASDAVATAGSDAVVATFDVSPDVLNRILHGRIAFAIDTKPYTQALTIASNTLSSLRAHLRFQARFGIDPDLVVETTPFTISTGLVSRENAAAYQTRYSQNPSSGRPGRP